MNESTRPIAAPRALHAFLLTVVGAGALVLAQSAIGAVGTPSPFACLAFVGLVLVAGWFRLTFMGGSATVGIDDTFLIAIALLFGTAPATLALSGAALVFSLRRRKPVRQVAFNVAALAISMWTAGRTFFALAL